MLASNANGSIPAWKISLIEKRRQQQELEKQAVMDESTRLAQMPVWKREVYLKKRMQKAEDGRPPDSGVNPPAELVRKPAFRKVPAQGNGDAVRKTKTEIETFDKNRIQESELISDDDFSDTERLLPIQKNPILQSDRHRRPAPTQNPVSNYKASEVMMTGSKDLNHICNGNGYSRHDRNFVEPGNWSENEDQEEMTYGRGFVSKLLGRFKEIEKNHASTLMNNVPKRACSSDNLLNDTLRDESPVRNCLMSGGLKFSKGKAQSMENLTVSTSGNTDSLTRQRRPLSVTNGFSTPAPPRNRFSMELDNKKTVPSRNREPTVDGNKGNNLSAPTPSVARAASPVPEEELPRSNIVLLTRTVFESIATSPPIDMPNSKRHLLPQRNSKPSGTITEKNVQNVRGSENVVHDIPDGYALDARDSRKAATSEKPLTTAARTDAFGDMQNQGGKLDILGSGKGLNGKIPEDKIYSHFDNTSNVQRTKNAQETQKTSDTLSSSSHVMPKLQMPSDSGTNLIEPVSGDSSVKTEVSRQHLILDLKDLPVLSQTPTSRNERVFATSDKIPTNAKAAVRNEDKNSRKSPGSLLIRPASNLLASSTKVEYLNLTKYNDIKTGEFAPPNKRPLYYNDDDDGYGSTIPVTNIDDVMDDGESDPREGDPSIYGNLMSRFEFEGAGMRLGRSLMQKTKDCKQLKIRFNDSAETTFEYPSEQSLINDWPEEDDDIDAADDDRPIELNSSLRHTPGIGSTGSLASYKSRHQVDYQIGMERPNDVISEVAPSSHSTSDADDVVLRPDDTSAWSSSASSDLLF